MRRQSCAIFHCQCCRPSARSDGCCRLLNFGCRGGILPLYGLFFVTLYSKIKNAKFIFEITLIFISLFYQFLGGDPGTGFHEDDVVSARPRGDVEGCHGANLRVCRAFVDCGAPHVHRLDAADVEAGEHLNLSGGWVGSDGDAEGVVVVDVKVAGENGGEDGVLCDGEGAGVAPVAVVPLLEEAVWGCGHGGEGDGGSVGVDACARDIAESRVAACRHGAFHPWGEEGGEGCIVFQENGARVLRG